MKLGTIFVAAALLLAACNDTIIVPLRACIVEGAQVTAVPTPQPGAPFPPNVECFGDAPSYAGGCYYKHPSPRTNGMVYDADSGVMPKVNAIWKQAQINFLACCQDVPIIPDPDTSIGRIGEIAYASGGRESAEMITARNACKSAWESRDPMITDGTVVILARDITNERGSRESTDGLTVEPNPLPLGELCHSPRNIAASDAAYSYVVVPEPDAFCLYRSECRMDIAERVLAHELGHALLLAHGDGLDDDHNGSEPESSGPRLFDQACDPSEYNAIDLQSQSQSLMTEGGSAQNLTALQIELARDVAAKVAGHFGP